MNRSLVCTVLALATAVPLLTGLAPTASATTPAAGERTASAEPKWEKVDWYWKKETCREKGFDGAQAGKWSEFECRERSYTYTSGHDGREYERRWYDLIVNKGTLEQQFTWHYTPEGELIKVFHPSAPAMG